MAPREDKHKVRDLTVRLWRDGTGAPLVYLHGAAGVPPWVPFFTRLAGKHEVLVQEHESRQSGVSSEVQLLCARRDLDTGAVPDCADFPVLYDDGLVR